MSKQNLTLAAVQAFAAFLFFFTLLILSAGAGYSESGIDNEEHDSWSCNDQSVFIIQSNN